MSADGKAAYCTGCGTRHDEDWDFCAHCGARRTVIRPEHATATSAPAAEDQRLLEDEASPSTTVTTAGNPSPQSAARVASPATSRLPASPESSPAAWTVGGALAIVAAVVSMFALFPDYYVGEDPLAADPVDVVYNIGPIAAWAVAGALLALRKLSRAAAALLVGVTVAWAPTYLSSAGRVLGGDAEGGLGFIAGMVGLASAMAASVAIAVGFTRATLDWRMPHTATIALVVASSAAMVFGLTTDWIRTSIVIGARLTEWTETGTDTMTYDCCSWSETSGSSGLSEAGFFLMPGAIALVAVTSVFLASARIRTGLLAGAAVVATAHVSSAAVWLSRSIDPVDDLGFTRQEVFNDSLSATQSALPGFWWMVGGLVGLVAVLAVLVLSEPDGGRATRATPAEPVPVDSPPVTSQPAAAPSAGRSGKEVARPTAWSGVALGVLATIFLGPVALYAGAVAAFALARNFIAGWLPSSWLSGNAADWLFASGTEGGAANYVTFMVAGVIAAGCVGVIKAAFASGQ